MDRIDIFKNSLAALDPKQVVRRHILSGVSHALPEEKEFELKDRISDYFDVEFSEVVVVGSGKLGFSIAPRKRYREFNEESDIDIAVVSEKLFNKVWKEAYLYRKSGAYWPKCGEFFRYLASGWIRPDKLPIGSSFRFTERWWNHYNELTSGGEFGPYKIRGGLYHSWFFFFQYQYQCIDQCASEIDDANISN